MRAAAATSSECFRIPKPLVGNADSVHVCRNELDVPVTARFLRFAVGCDDKLANVALRLEVYCREINQPTMMTEALNVEGNERVPLKHVDWHTPLPPPGSSSRWCCAEREVQLLKRIRELDLRVYANGKLERLSEELPKQLQSWADLLRSWGVERRSDLHVAVRHLLEYRLAVAEYLLATNQPFDDCLKGLVSREELAGFYSLSPTDPEY